MKANELKRLYENTFRTWLVRNKKISYEEIVNILTKCATSFPPNNQINISSEDIDLLTIEKLREDEFLVTQLRHEITDDSPLYYMISF